MELPAKYYSNRTNLYRNTNLTANVMTRVTNISDDSRKVALFPRVEGVARINRRRQQVKLPVIIIKAIYGSLKNLVKK